MARRDGGGRSAAGSAFRASWLAIRARQWRQWATDGMRAEHEETDRAIRSGEAVPLAPETVFAVLDAMGDQRAAAFAWGGDGYAQAWTLTVADELTPADGAA
ncbi:hypothetical protein [Humibacillus xanthopallidus]|uniref:Uncharacterized protein n=1 Tax=Humibacillus xanthopallidus TaxID=412689 RepID=A0A543HW71_9MICO|nr:hypothetical protein [Humibacillus xanthopallidus]TQM62593.1 hypothetical protein FBY41_2629 [Humibacillus xanthopallidus]